MEIASNKRVKRTLTRRAKGFAFISFTDRADAARACEKMDGFGFKHLILRVEFAKKAQ